MASGGSADLEHAQAVEVLQESAEDFGGEGWLVGWWGVGGEVLFEFVQGAWSVGEEGEDGFQQGG
ncbi:hypothetical protein CFC35_42015, partial [Streptomyces sp. FBKL.4005]